MKASLYRLMIALCMCSLIAGLTVIACGGDEPADERQAAEPADENFSTRQAGMKEISQICGGIMKMLKEVSVESIVADAARLKEIMAEVATIPPPYDTEKYKF